MSYAKYTKALGSLYGDVIEEPAASALPTTGSFAKSQKNSLPHLKRKNIEAGMQMKLIVWLTKHGLGRSVHSIPNEGNRGQLATHRLKQMGLRPGASDLFLQKMRGGYGGYYIELKTPGKKPSAEQLLFMEDARRDGYKAEWFDDLAEVQQSIIDYLAQGTPKDAKQF
jgi:hypothetical protein